MNLSEGDSEHALQILTSNFQAKLQTVKKPKTQSENSSKILVNDLNFL